MSARFFLLALIVLISTSAIASDRSPLQDFRVADNTSNVFVNGFACKDPKLVKAKDFFFSSLDRVGNMLNPVGSKVTLINVDRILGLNTRGISMAHVDCPPNGLNPPHTHPRATEILTVIEGLLFVGFVTSNPDNKLFNKILQKGEEFVFPHSLIHFQFNIGKTNAMSISGLSSQNPIVSTIANAVFGLKLDIIGDILAKGFQIDGKIITLIQSKF